MTIIDVLNALSALAELRKFKLPFAKAAQVFKLCRQLESVRSFYAEEEHKLLEQYAKKRSDGLPDITETGQVTFDSYTDRTAYCEKVNELYALDVSTCGAEITPLKLTESDFGSQTVSPAMLDELGCLVEIE